MFARLLRALLLATTHGLTPIEWMDCDARSFRRALRVGGVQDIFAGGMPTVAEYISRQRFVRHELILAEVSASVQALGSRSLDD